MHGRRDAHTLTTPCHLCVHRAERQHPPAVAVADLVAATSRKPDLIKAAHTGVGTPPHLGLLSFQKATGAQMVHVPYKGAAQAITDVLGGHVAFFFSSAPAAIPHVRTGKLKAIAVATKLTEHYRNAEKFIGAPPEEMLFCGVAIGHVDDSAPINTLRSERMPLEAFARFL